MMKINKDEHTFEYEGETYPLIDNTDITPEEMNTCIEHARCVIKKMIKDIDDDK